MCARVTEKEISHLLEKVISIAKEGRRPPWGEVGVLLDMIEKSGYWKQSSDSFSEWVRNHSNSLGAKEGTLWRYLSSVRIYNNFRETIPLFFGGTAQPIEDMCFRVSAESLELLSKLQRVLPKDRFTALARNTMTGHSSRSELRSLWETYRPILSGKTARGRGVKAPQINLDDTSQQESLEEATALNTLINEIKEWTYFKTLKNYALFQKLQIPFKEDYLTIDAVALTREKETSPLLFHGIVVVGRGKPIPNFKLKVFSDYCNFLWLLYCDHLHLEQDLEENIGILTLESPKRKIYVAKTAKPSSNFGGKNGELAKILLLRNLGR